jgi:hypothetical protein
MIAVLDRLLGACSAALDGPFDDLFGEFDTLDGLMRRLEPSEEIEG